MRSICDNCGHSYVRYSMNYSMDEQCNGLCPNCNNIARANRSRDAQENAELAGGILVLVILAVVGLFTGIAWLVRWLVQRQRLSFAEWYRRLLETQYWRVLRKLGLPIDQSEGMQVVVQILAWLLWGFIWIPVAYAFSSENSFSSYDTVATHKPTQDLLETELVEKPPLPHQGQSCDIVNAELGVQPTEPPPLPLVHKPLSQAGLIRFQCNHCGAKLTAKHTKAGRTAPCPKCQRQVKVVEGIAIDAGQKPSPSPKPSPQSPIPPQPINGSFSRSGSKKQQSMIAAACIFGFLCIPILGFAVMVTFKTQSMKSQCRQAETLWENGDREEAVSIYRSLRMTGKAEEPGLLIKSMYPGIYGRLIDYEVTQGNVQRVTELLKEAERFKITPRFDSIELQQLIAGSEQDTLGLEDNSESNISEDGDHSYSRPSQQLAEVKAMDEPLAEESVSPQNRRHEVDDQNEDRSDFVRSEYRHNASKKQTEPKRAERKPDPVRPQVQQPNVDPEAQRLRNEHDKKVGEWKKLFDR